MYLNTWTYNQLHVEKCHSENCMVKTVWGKLQGENCMGKTAWGKLHGENCMVKTARGKLQGENCMGKTTMGINVYGERGSMGKSVWG